MSREEEDLSTHVSICELRYKGLQDQVNKVEGRFDKLESELGEFKAATSQALSDIKDLINNKQSSQMSTIITAGATVIVTLLSVLGYLIVHAPAVK
jgi:chromosome segregation ATPase